MVQYQDPMKDKPILKAGQHHGLQIAGAVMGAIGGFFLAAYYCDFDVTWPILVGGTIFGAVSGYMAPTASS